MPKIFRSLKSIVLPALIAGTALQAAPVLTGVFTQEQADAGKRAYDTQCAVCHGADLLGPNAPALIGSEVMHNFDNVAGLYDYTVVAMPPQAPGRLSEADYVNIIAYILRVNGAPAGNTPLKADPALMRRLLLATVTTAPGTTTPGNASSQPASAGLAAANGDVPQAYTWGKTLPSVR